MSRIHKGAPPIPPRPDIDERIDTNKTPSPSSATRAAAQHQAEQAPPVQRKFSQAEAERLLAQSGFVRSKSRRGKGVELDDVTQGPIPLPVDEVDETAWEQGTLDEAQQELTMQQAQLAQLSGTLAASGPHEGGLFTALANITHQPTSADIARLEALNDAPEIALVTLDDVHQSIAQLFGIQLAHVPAGPAMVAASLVVAGLRDNVVPDSDSLQATRLAGGIEKLVKSGHGAVDDARQMSSGITKQLATHRTFVFKK